MIDLKEPDALAPCPFCGGHAYYNHTDAGPERKYYRVHCEKCDARIGHPYVGKDAARQAWNTRAALTPAPIDVDVPILDVITWLEERRDNCLRIAETKTEELDKAGWYLDAEEFQRAIDAISSKHKSIDIESLKRGPGSEDEAMCQVTSIYNDGWNHCVEELHATGRLCAPLPEIKGLDEAIEYYGPDNAGEVRLFDTTNEDFTRQFKDILQAARAYRERMG